MVGFVFAVTTITKQPDNPSPLIATFEVSGTDALSGLDVFSCSLDGAPFIACTNPQHYNTLSAGEHTFRASDGQFNSNLATVTINVTPVDDPLVVNPTLVTIAEDTPISLTLNVLDVDGDVLIYQVLRQPAHRALRGALPKVMYTPTANFNGNDSFTFSVSDSAMQLTGSALSALITGTVHITITAVNDAPVAATQTVATTPGAPVALTLAATDADGDALTYSLVTGPQHGTVTGTAPNLLYTPANNFTGDDPITFQVSDGQATSNVATILIRVTDKPFALLLPLVRR